MWLCVLICFLCSEWLNRVFCYLFFLMFWFVWWLFLMNCIWWCLFWCCWVWWFFWEDGFFWFELMCEFCGICGLVIIWMDLFIMIYLMLLIFCWKLVIEVWWFWLIIICWVFMMIKVMFNLFVLLKGLSSMDLWWLLKVVFGICWICVRSIN